MGLPGLNEILATKRIKLKPGEFAMFLNRKQDKVKIVWSGEYMLMVGKAKGRISLDDLRAIPAFFRSNFLSSQIAKQIESHLGVTAYVTEDGLQAS